MLEYDQKSINEKIGYRIPEEMPFPKVILIDTISFCNLKCAMCPHKEMTRKPGIMPWPLYIRIVDEIAEKQPDAQIWITFFGEGLMLKDLPDRIEYAKSKGLKNIILNTNGNLTSPQTSEKLIKAGLTGFYVGIDATRADTYESIRVGGSLDKVVQGVLDYKTLLNQYGTPDQTVVVQFVEMENNRDQVDEFVEFWNGHGVKCKIRPMVSWAGKTTAPNLVDDYERLPCYWCMNTLQITDTGKIPLCTCDLNCEVELDSIADGKTLEEVWNTTHKRFRDTQRARQWDDLPELCRNCKDWQSGYAVYK